MPNLRGVGLAHCGEVDIGTVLHLYFDDVSQNLYWRGRRW